MFILHTYKMFMYIYITILITWFSGNIPIPTQLNSFTLKIYLVGIHFTIWKSIILLSLASSSAVLFYWKTINVFSFWTTTQSSVNLCEVFTNIIRCSPYRFKLLTITIWMLCQKHSGPRKWPIILPWYWAFNIALKVTEWFKPPHSW